MLFSPAFCDFLPLKLKYSPQHPVPSNILNLSSSLDLWDQLTHEYKTTGASIALHYLSFTYNFCYWDTNVAQLGHTSTPVSHTLSMEKELEPRNVHKVCGTWTINKFVKTMYNHFPIWQWKKSGICISFIGILKHTFGTFINRKTHQFIMEAIKVTCS